MKKILSAVLFSFFVSLFAIPSFVSAQSALNTDTDEIVGQESSCVVINDNIRTSVRVRATKIKNIAEDVINLQEFFIPNGYFSRSIMPQCRQIVDPIPHYGPCSVEAVINFKKDYNIYPLDGFVGKETRKKINEVSCSGTATPVVTPLTTLPNQTQTTITQNTSSNQNLPAGCTSRFGFSTTVANTRCDTTTAVATACANGEPYSSYDGLPCSGSTTNTTVGLTITSVPSVKFTASRTAIVGGEQVRLMWSSTNATSCSLSGNNIDIIQNLPLQGDQTFWPNVTTTYRIYCGNSASTATENVTVNVTAPVAISATNTSAPTLIVGFTPSTVAVGQLATLTWSSTGATTCTGYENGSPAQYNPDNVGLNGSATQTGSETKTYTFTCTGSGGSVTKSVTVTVTPTTTPTTGEYILDTTRTNNSFSYYVYSTDSTKEKVFVKTFGATLTLDKAGITTEVTGGNGVEKIYVKNGASVDVTKLNSGFDEVYLDGTWAAYTKTYAGTVVTMTRMVGSNTETIKFLGGSTTNYDKIAFADYTFKSAEILSILNGSALSPFLRDLNRTTNDVIYLVDSTDLTKQKVHIITVGGTVALTKSGVTTEVTGSAGNDRIDVATGASANVTNLGGGSNSLYLTGKLADYTQLIDQNTGVYTLTRTSGLGSAQSEIVKFTVGDNNDNVYFADGNININATTNARLFNGQSFNNLTLDMFTSTANSPASQSQFASVLSAFSGSNTSPSGTAGIAQPAPEFTYSWNNNLQIASPYINDIIALQTALKREGVYDGELTGGFYNQTFTAVKAFQQKYNIEATGFVGPETRARLNSIY